MNCKQCNQPIAENELFCKHCGYKGPQEEQKVKVAEAKQRLRDILIPQCHTPIFLIFTICFTIMTISQVASIFTGGFGNILPAIFMIVGTVGLWGSRGAKDNAHLVKKIKKASAYDAYVKVIYSIIVTLLTIAFFGMIIVYIIVLVNTMDYSAEIPILDIVKAVLTMFLIWIIPTLIIGAIGGIYESRRDYFKALSKYAETGEYTEESAPVVGSYILGGWSIFCGLGTFLSSMLTTVLSGMMLGFIEGLGNAEALSVFKTVLDFVEKLLVSNMIANIIAGISTLILGGYYILSAVWMSKTHEALSAARLEVKESEEALEKLERDTAAAMVEYDNQKTREAKAEREAAAAEAQKAQAAMQEQQNAMMQMMMQQMMANGMMPNMNGAAPAAPAAEAAPVEEAPVEAAPAEEAPAEEAPAEV